MLVLLSPAAKASLARNGCGSASHDDSGVVLIQRSWMRPEVTGQAWVQLLWTVVGTARCLWTCVAEAAVDHDG